MLSVKKQFQELMAYVQPAGQSRATKIRAKQGPKVTATDGSPNPPSYEEALLLPSLNGSKSRAATPPRPETRQHATSVVTPALRRSKSDGALSANAIKAAACVATRQAGDVAIMPRKVGGRFEPSAALLGEITLSCNRVRDSLGFAPTVGLQRFACLGGACMSLGGLIMAMAGVPFGGLAIAGIGLSVLTLCVLTGLIWNTLERRRKLPAIKVEHRQHLIELQQRLKDEGCPPNNEAWLHLQKTIAMIDGGFAYTALEILRGTVLQIVVVAYEAVSTMTRYRNWRTAQQQMPPAPQAA